MKTVVINNKEGMNIGQLPPLGVESNGRTMVGGIVVLMPGLNLVDSKDLAVLRKNPVFERNFTTKIGTSVAQEHPSDRAGNFILEVMHFEKKDKDGKITRYPAEVEDEFPLAKLTEPQCKEMVDLVDVPEMLRAWAMQETRPFVHFEIQRRLKKINGEEE